MISFLSHDEIRYDSGANVIFWSHVEVTRTPACTCNCRENQFSCHARLTTSPANRKCGTINYLGHMKLQTIKKHKLKRTKNIFRPLLIIWIFHKEQILSQNNKHTSILTSFYFSCQLVWFFLFYPNHLVLFI